MVEPPGTAQGARNIAMNTIDTVLALMKPEISRGRNQQIFTQRLRRKTIVLKGVECDRWCHFIQDQKLPV